VFRPSRATKDEIHKCKIAICFGALHRGLVSAQRICPLRQGAKFLAAPATTISAGAAQTPPTCARKISDNAKRKEICKPLPIVSVYKKGRFTPC
jgi:hypothetical protein